MNTSHTSPRHLVAFFVLVYVMSAPFWILSTFTISSWLPDNIPITDIGAALTPTIAATILRYRENGFSGVRALPQRTEASWRGLSRNRSLVGGVSPYCTNA